MGTSDGGMEWGPGYWNGMRSREEWETAWNEMTRSTYSYFFHLEWNGMEWNEMTVTSFTLNMPLMCSTCVALVKEDALSLIPSMRALVVSAI